MRLGLEGGGSSQEVCRGSREPSLKAKNLAVSFLAAKKGNSCGCDEKNTYSHLP